MDDLPVITELQRRCDLAAFGEPEHDESEIREELERVGSLAEHSRLVLDGGDLLAAAWHWSTEATLLVDPATAAGPLHADLLPWFERQGIRALPVLSSDEALRAALATRGWRQGRSVFDLLRPVEPDWVIAAPVWDEGLAIRELGPDDAAAVHHLVYVDAAWADVPGHHRRDLAEWRDIFLSEAAAPDRQVLAWRGDRLVGAAIGRMYSGAVGWIDQLAVARGERGRGIGRALLLEAFRRWTAAGATALGLGVLADNRGALRLYLDVGLRVTREWQDFEPPR